MLAVQVHAESSSLDPDQAFLLVEPRLDIMGHGRSRHAAVLDRLICISYK